MKNVKEVLRRCIKEESAALLYLADTIDEIDIQFLDKIKDCKGNIIFSGIGKSFMVGNKIAGILSSIGVTA